MKKALSALVLSLSALAFTSCCGLGSLSLCNKQKSETVTETIPDPNKKNGFITKTVEVPVEGCPSCTQYVKYEEGCCGSVSDSTIARASAQGWNGTAHVGLIPTMKKVVE